MKLFVGSLAAGLMLLSGTAVLHAGPPDGTAEGTHASCAGVAFSDHATGNSHDGTTQRQVIHEAVPFVTNLLGIRKGEFFRSFAGLHVDTHVGCEEVLLGA
jgi:hypothetical protein